LPKLNNYTEHVHFTLENLLNWGKNQMKGENVNPVKIDLHTMVSNTIALYSEALTKKQLHLELIITKEISAWVDEEDLNVVFRNLLSNAIKFTPSNGNISIAAKLQKNEVLITFKDDGVGMSIETQKLVYDSSQHYSTFGTNNEKGTGLGLMLCKTLVARNNGKLSFFTEENIGTTFSILLPVDNQNRKVKTQ